MRNLSLLTKLFLTAMLGLGLALFGCPPDTSDDDDDDATSGDDDVSDDDVSDDDVSDDDVSDDDVSDDDTGGTGVYYSHDQDLAGAPSTNMCPDCEFSFDIDYTTTDTYGSSCFFCYDFPDGTYTLGVDMDYYIDYYGNLYGPYQMVFWYYGGWNWWYSAYADYNGHSVVFWYYGSYYNYSVYQYGYWDIAGGGMTGKASTIEATM